METRAAPVVIPEDEHDRWAMWRVLVRALRSAFPHVDIEEINRFEPLADEIDLTFDEFTQLMTAITEEIGVVVPEEDYPLVGTLDGLEQYLNSRVSFTGVQMGAMSLSA